MTSNRTTDAIRSVAALALLHAPALVPELLPEGKRQGSEWWSRNPTRADRHAGSFSVSLMDGRWHDFASGDRGGDLVSLAAFLWGVRQTDAARDLARRLGLDLAPLEGYGAPHAMAAQQQRLAEALRLADERLAAEDRQRRQDQQKAAGTAQRWWRDGRRADPAHPYLAAKGISPYILRQRGDLLLVPMYAGGRLLNLQRIGHDGVKKMLYGAQVTGCYSPLGRIEGATRLFVCEGWATGATLHEHERCPVACAMTAGNLKAVALALRERYGAGLELVIAGDDDRETEGNPGRTAANAAALAAGALVTFPDFPAEASASLNDFNDLAVWRAQHGQA